jgi:hypothetical protein
MDKYKWKYRILLIETDSYKNKDYIETRNKYNKNLYKFHKRYVKMITKRNKNNIFQIKLIGFDGKIKKKYNKLIINDVLKTIDNMPLSKLKSNLSLYADYNPKTTIKGLGFKNKEKALYTIKKIKNKSIDYQIRVLNTMIGRAKNHPYKTKNMDEAIKILKKYLQKIKS